MIALFKESAMKLMNQEQGAIIPFNVFYDALHQFLDHSHKGVITRAMDNAYINPDRKADCFNVNVLKTLFMIKYVKEITANLDNITSLMIAEIDRPDCPEKTGGRSLEGADAPDAGSEKWRYLCFLNR